MVIEALLEVAELLTARQAHAEFPLGSTIGEALSEREPRLVAVVRGDVRLEGHLLLDWKDDLWLRDGKRLAGLIVEGDLDVDGSILNTEGDFGPFLLVLGSLAAEHGIFGGSVVHVAGDAAFSGLVVGFYNHGTAEFAGGLDAALVIGDDHDLRFRAGPPCWEVGLSNFGFPLSAYLADAIPVGVDEDDGTIEVLYGIDPEDGASYVETFDHILDHIERGLPVMRSDQPVAGREGWIRAVRESKGMVEHLPAEFRDAAFFLDLVTDRGFAVASVPREFLTEDVADRAIRDQGLAIFDLPEEWLTITLYRTALESATLGALYRNTPESFKRAHPELIEEVLAEDVELLEEVPRELVTETMVLEVIAALDREDSYAYASLLWLPEGLRTDAVIRALALNSPYSLKSVPVERLSASLLAAVTEKHGTLPSSILESLPAGVLEELDARRREAPATAVHWEALGVRFRHPAAWTGEVEPAPGDRQVWTLEGEGLIVVVIGLPPNEAADYRDLVAHLERSAEAVHKGMTAAGMPVRTAGRAPFEQEGFSGEAVDVRQKVTESLSFVKRSLYVQREVGTSRVVVNAQYRKDKESLILPELRRFLASFGER